jgi:hypothetical protein
MKESQIDFERFKVRPKGVKWLPLADRIKKIKPGKMLVIPFGELPSEPQTQTPHSTHVYRSLSMYFPGGFRRHGIGIRTTKDGAIAFCCWEDPSRNESV